MTVSSTQSISGKISADKYLDEKKDITSPCFGTFDVDEAEAPSRNVEAMGVCGCTHGPNEGGRATTSKEFTREVDDKKLKQNEKKGKNVDLDISSDINHGTHEAHHHSYAEHHSALGEFHRDAHTVVKGIASSSALPMQDSPSTQHNISTVATEQGGVNIMSKPRDMEETLDKLESSAENDPEAEGSKHLDSRNHHDDIHIQEQHEDITLRGKNDLRENCLTTRVTVEIFGEGTGKALSDGVVNIQLSNEDNSQDSVGSCNSKRLVSKVRKKRILDQQLAVQSKRLKQPMQGVLSSASFIKQSSSFMCWISNMIKGYPVPIPDEKPSPALTNSKHENHDRKPVARSRENIDTGFKNVFQSLYCSNNNGKGKSKIYLNYQSKDGSDDAKDHSKIVDVGAVPLTIFQTSGNIIEHFHSSSGTCDQTTSGSIFGTPTKQHMIVPTNTPVGDSKSFTGMNVIWQNVGNRKEMDMRSPSNHKSEDKATHVSGKKSDLLRSLWIARFCPKNIEPVSNSNKDHHVKIKVDSTLMLPHTEISGHSARGPINVVESEPSPDDLINPRSEGHYESVNTEGSIGSKQVKLANEQKPEYNLEAMASAFARRLDALKQVIPYNDTDTSAPTPATCLFCGARGHDLQACPEVPKNELKDLQEKIESYDRVEESPCFCIKCFQLSHWAINCLKGLSQKSPHGTTVDQSNAIDMNLKRSKEGKDLLDMIDHTVCVSEGGGNCRPNLKKMDEVTACIEHSNDLAGRKADQSSGPSLSSGMPRKVSNATQGIFDALRRLRLSRSDVLRLMDSKISLFHLGGFYLRVRLSNSEEGLGRRGYYVACINGAPNEPSGSRTRVAVTIGSFRGLVESQYISNQDFNEDELVAWWSAAANGGHGRIPSEDELQLKYEQRKRLGF